MPTLHRALPALRHVGLAIVSCAILLALPSPVEAQNHLTTIGKSCVSPKNTCASNADCADPNSCSGQGICSSSGANHMNECTITLTNPVSHADNVRVLGSSDTVTTGTGPVTFNNLPISGTTGTVSGDCTGTIDPAVGCTLAPGASISFLSNQYTIQPADPDPLPDQGIVNFQDLCNNSPTGCSTGVSGVQITASTDLVSGCLPGPTCTPTPTSTPTNTPTSTPTNTPTPTSTRTNTPVNTPTNTPGTVPPPTVPTLSFPMMALLGLALAGAGLFLARRG